MEQYTPNDINGAKLLGNYAPGSPEWHSERARGIGGSEVGTILGLNPWESAYALWAKKTGKIPSEIKENWAIRFGKAFEDPILVLWQEEHPEYDVYTTGTYQDENCDYRHANPDAIAIHKKTGEMKVIEVKTARQTWEDVPPAYVAQVLHYMGVLKIQSGVIVAVAGMTWNEYEVEYNQLQIDIQNEYLEKFWDSVQQDIKPPWDGSESTYTAIRGTHQEINSSEVALGEVGIELLHAQQHADDSYRNLMKLKSIVLDKLGTAKWGTVETKDGPERVVSRQLRAGTPSLIVNKKGISWI